MSGLSSHIDISLGSLLATLPKGQNYPAVLTPGQAMIATAEKHLSTCKFKPKRLPEKSIMPLNETLSTGTVLELIQV